MTISQALHHSTMYKHTHTNCVYVCVCLYMYMYVLVCACVCVCVCVCVFTKISAMFEPLPYHTGNAHTHTQTALLCSGFTFFIVAFVVFRLKITQPCVFCRSKELLKCCPYVTHIHTYNTNIQKINCLHIHRYAYLYEHV